MESFPKDLTRSYVENIVNSNKEKNRIETLTTLMNLIPDKTPEFNKYYEIDVKGYTVDRINEVIEMIRTFHSDFYIEFLGHPKTEISFNKKDPPALLRFCYYSFDLNLRMIQQEKRLIRSMISKEIYSNSNKEMFVFTGIGKLYRMESIDQVCKELEGRGFFIRHEHYMKDYPESIINDDLYNSRLIISIYDDGQII